MEEEEEAAVACLRHNAVRIRRWLRRGKEEEHQHEGEEEVEVVSSAAC